MYLPLILSLLASSPSDVKLPTAAGAGEVFVCDFEEATDRDYDGWPDRWVRSRGRELPEFLRIEIVPDPAAANRCLQITLDGGGAIVSSPPVAVSSHFSFLLTCRLKTAGLKHDAAWLALSLLDAEGNVLQSHSSPPLTAAPDWQAVRIGPIAAVSPRAVRAVIALHLQPLDQREDLTGRAWFDDVRIVRLPRMLLSSNLAAGICTSRDTPELVCEVSGIRVRNPQVRFELFDQAGQRLARHDQSLLSPDEVAKAAEMGLPESGYAGRARWQPPLSAFGYYKVRASLVEENGDEVLLDRTQSIAMVRQLPPPLRSAFGWTLEGAEQPYAYGPLTALLAQSGCGWAKMPVWYDARENKAADRIAWFAEQLSIQGIELVGVLDQPPADLRQVFREPGRLPVATVFAEPELWQPSVAPVMTRLSLKVRYWQLGNDQDVSFIGYPQLGPKVADIKRRLEEYTQQIHLGLNWRWMYGPPPEQLAGGPWSFLSYGVDPPLTAEEIGAYLQKPAAARAVAQRPRSALPTSTGPQTARSVRPTFGPRREWSGPQRWMLLSPLPKGEYPAEVRVRDLVLRMLAAKMHRADAVFVPQPFSDEEGVMNADGSPGELLVPFRTTAMLVGGAEYLGAIQMPGGNAGHLFAQDGRAVMAIWSHRETTERVAIGDEIEQLDVYGRGVKPPHSEQDGQSLVELKIGPMPTFVIGLREAVARFQAAAEFESTQLASVAGREQTLYLRLANTLHQPISGELTLHAPKSWGIDTRATRFRIGEGETLRLPLPVTLAADANSGPQPVRLDFELSGQGGSSRFSVYRTLQLGLDDVQVELTTRLRAKDGALVAELHLANQADFPLSFRCVLFAPGRRRETRQVIDLGRERTTLTYVLPRGEELIGKKLWLQAEEIGGSRVLNHTLTAER
ncbi:MAG TPA: hypothetical protein VFB80_18785 [Pirellulaceae bacterium]|nr:hypothetical protein [Pirellulaceae bacterium]